ncbi:Putative serine/threonine-protein kinase Atg1 [Septoria linicola]|uniref:non-specific serine/threonine protein kinase n=1 Tax=Septoria linicola TaxID=215465 RepID=A0A9Q9AXX1_9PEZI|nr:Putative serine/threonine-protein kinase Atg1 [Septoria linicola]
MAAHMPPGSSRRPPPPLEVEPDEIIGEFRRGKEIGKGSFATVYLAQHRKRKSYAAVKAVQMGKLSKKLKENLATEIEILKGLKHPHIVQLFVCTDTSSYIYLVMEYCQLSDLAQFMKKRHQLPSLPETADIFRKYPNPEYGGLNEVLARHFLKQITSALQYLRSHNLIHRDIKPQNLLLNPAPTYMSRLKPEDVPLAASENSLTPAVGVASLPMLKIADFGFARHLPSTSMAETLCGSPLYMAPEILRYEKYDARADLWSTGTVLHEMIVGKPPFRAQNHVDLLRKIEKANDVIVFDNKNMTISRGMKDLIRKLLKKSPVERLTYENLFADPVVVGEIPGLHSEDKVQERGVPAAEEQMSELSRKMARAMETEPSPRSNLTPELQKKRSEDEVPRRTVRKPSEEAIQQRPPIDAERRKSSTGSAHQPETTGLRRQPSQREQRRPSIVAHITAPGRQELHQQQAPLNPAPPMPRRASRSSPLAGPPLVRQPTIEAARDSRANREARERIANEVAFEKEYVVIEKRAVEVNAFADELDAMHGSPANQGAMVRRATTQGQPTSISGATSSNSRAVQMIPGRNPHQRGGSFERRHPYSPQSATNMLTKALTAANARIFGAGTSPPFAGPSPPRGYGAFPAYPSPAAALTLGDVNDAKPMDEDTRLVRTLEEAAHRSDVIYGFAEVKYRQIQPAPPSSQDALGIQQIGASAKAAEGDTEDKDMTNIAIVGVAEEALVLYVKALAILTKTIDLAGSWWNKQKERGESSAAESSSGPHSAVGSRILAVVKWSRTRFNECLEKSEVAGRRLQHAQRQLPEQHSGHPNNHDATSGSEVATSADHIRITSGVTAERLMFDRAVEMSRAAAVSELVGEELSDCELGYKTAIMLLEAVLENDEEPLMRKPSQKKDKPADEIINGMETEDRQTVLRIIENARSRLTSVRKKIYAAQYAVKRAPSSGTSTPKPMSNPSPSMIAPGISSTPPR